MVLFYCLFIWVSLIFSVMWNPYLASDVYSWKIKPIIFIFTLIILLIFVNIIVTQDKPTNLNYSRLFFVLLITLYTLLYTILIMDVSDCYETRDIQNMYQGYMQYHNFRSTFFLAWAQHLDVNNIPGGLTSYDRIVWSNFNSNCVFSIVQSSPFRFEVDYTDQGIVLTRGLREYMCTKIFILKDLYTIQAKLERGHSQVFFVLGREVWSIQSFGINMETPFTPEQVDSAANRTGLLDHCDRLKYKVRQRRRYLQELDQVKIPENFIEPTE